MSTVFNESVSIREQSYSYWQFKLRNESGLKLQVISSPDWVGVNIFVASESEFRLFKKGKIFNTFSDLSYKNAVKFTGSAILSKGKYYIIIENPNRYYDGEENIAQASMRLDLLM
jgi:hypothetical protein